MKKKLTFLVCSLIAVFCLAACGSTADTTYGGYTASDLQAASQNIAEKYVLTMDAAGAKQAADYYSTQAKTASTEEAEQYKTLSTLFSNWADTADVVGDFQGYSDFKIDKTGKTMTTTLFMNCSKRNAKLSVVYTVYNMKISSINVEPVYTMGETLQKAGMNVVIGLCTVFVMLILISLLISCFRIIPYLQGKFTKKNEAPAPAAEAPVSAAPAAEDENNEELVAVIAAAIAASTGESTDSFVVRSIRRRF